MSKVKPKLNLTQVGRVCVTVADTDRAIDFYVDALGFEKTVDVPMGDGYRWVEVALPGAVTTIALAPPPPETEAGGSQTGICIDTSDVDADHAALKAAGADVDDEISRWGEPVPPMFWLRPGRELADHRSALRVANAFSRALSPAGCDLHAEGLCPAVRRRTMGRRRLCRGVP